MRKFLIMVTLIVCMMTAVVPVSAKTPKSDIQIVKMLCKKQHKPYKIVNSYTKAVRNRKGKQTLFVEKVISFSNGKGGRNAGGYDKNGCYTAYNKRVPKGRKVVSYIIYSNKTNEPDDILWAVDNGKYH